MSSRAALFQMWAEDRSTLEMGARELSEEVGCESSSVNVYRSQFRKLYPQSRKGDVLSQEQLAAGKRLRNNEQRRKWKIEEAVAALRKENASMEEIVSYWRAA